MHHALLIEIYKYIGLISVKYLFHSRFAGSWFCNDLNMHVLVTCVGLHEENYRYFEPYFRVDFEYQRKCESLTLICRSLL